MGRKLMRVPLDFDWPIEKIWEGYVNPHYKRCDACNGSGQDASRKALESLVRLILLAGEQSRGPRGRGIFPHPFLQTEGLWFRQHSDIGTTLHEISTGLAGREPSPMGHDCCDHLIALEKVIKAAGKDPDKWGICAACGGSGQDPSTKAASDAWQSHEPPTGDGFQLWETTSEGSPVSPVFLTLDDLCQWCASHATTFGSFKTNAEEWKRMLEDGLVCHREGFMAFM